MHKFQMLGDYVLVKVLLSLLTLDTIIKEPFKQFRVKKTYRMGFYYNVKREIVSISKRHHILHSLISLQRNRRSSYHKTTLRTSKIFIIDLQSSNVS